MNAMDTADKLREIWEERENVMARLLDIKSDIERNGVISQDERDGIAELKSECEDIAHDLGRILEAAS